MSYSTKKDKSLQFKNECNHADKSMNETTYLCKEIDKANPSYR